MAAIHRHTRALELTNDIIKLSYYLNEARTDEAKTAINTLIDLLKTARSMLR